MEIKLLNSSDFLKIRDTDTTSVFLVKEEEGNLFSQLNLLTESIHSGARLKSIVSCLFAKTLEKGGQL